MINIATAAVVAQLATQLAIVTQDQTSLRASPHDSAQTQAQLVQGDWLEVRGEKLDYLQVWDHRRERGGFVRAALVQRVSTAPDDAPQLLSVLRFAKSSPGNEALGIAYAAAYLKAVPAKNLDAEPLDAIGQMSERLARRANTARASATQATAAAHLDLAASYGVKMQSIERDGRMQICYDGQAYRQVLAMPVATPEQIAHAALGLTAHDCVDPAMPVLERYAFNEWRMQVLDRVPADKLVAYKKNRVELRRAGVAAQLAFERSKRNGQTQASAGQALNALAAINKPELSDDDQLPYAEAAIRVSASRWAAAAGPAQATPRLLVQILPGRQAGESCVSLSDSKMPAGKPLVQRCTFATVWLNSAQGNLAGTALALAVQPLEAWREMWMFRSTAQGWVVDVLPPGTNQPEVGYVEFAGWVPGGTHFLAAREVITAGRWRRTFELLRLDSLATEKQADMPSSLSVFYKWQDVSWKNATVSLR